VIKLKSNKRALLTELRKSKGTQMEVAKHLGISRQYIGMLESGERNPTVKLMAKMEKYFEMSASKLLPDLFFEDKSHKTKQKIKSA